jgi:hypothetical protein
MIAGVSLYRVFEERPNAPMSPGAAPPVAEVARPVAETAPWLKPSPAPAHEQQKIEVDPPAGVATKVPQSEPTTPKSKKAGATKPKRTSVAPVTTESVSDAAGSGVGGSSAGEASTNPAPSQSEKPPVGAPSSVGGIFGK